jgi:hypothetical protein
MNQMNRFAVVVAGALLGAVGFAHSASAVALVEGTGLTAPSLLVGGETVTETSCTSALCNFLSMSLDGAGTGFTITGTNATNGSTGGGSSVESTTSSPVDISATFSVTGLPAISQVGLMMASSINLTSGTVNNNDISVGETVNVSGGGTRTGSVNNGSVGETWIPLPAGQTSIDLTKDISITPSTRSPFNGVGTWTVSSVTEDFRFGVPEPMSAALLSVGLLVAVRARMQRRRR